MKPTTATVIVPAYNSVGTLGACLEALIDQDVPTDVVYDIIVIDDASTDGTQAVAQAIASEATIPIRVISEGRLGKSGTRNRGAQLSQAEILLFTDADCIPTPNWIATMLSPFRDPDIAGLKGAYLTHQRGYLPRFVQVEHQERYERMARLPQIDFIDTYSAGYRRDVFLAHGGFDEQLTMSYVEDQEFSFRLASAGCKMVFIPDALVYHQHVNSLTDYFRRKFAIASWKALIVRRHPERFVADSHTPQMIKVQMALFLLFVPALLFTPLLLLVGAAFVLSCIPLLRLARRYDPALIPVIIPFVLVRAAGLALGYIYGTIRWRGKKGRKFVRSMPVSSNTPIPGGSAIKSK